MVACEQSLEARAELSVEHRINHRIQCRVQIAEPEQHGPNNVVGLQFETVQQGESQPTEDEAACDDRDGLRCFYLQRKAFLVSTAGLLGLPSLHQLAQRIVAEFGSKRRLRW